MHKFSTLISARDSAHDFSVKFSPCVLVLSARVWPIPETTCMCVAIVASGLRGTEMAVICQHERSRVFNESYTA